MVTTYLSAPKQLNFKEVPLPVPKKNEVRVALHQVGICGSDIHLFLGHRKGPIGVALGHEAVGHIDAVGTEISADRLGERVVIEPNICCGKCRFCLANRTAFCENKEVIGLTRNGCFATHVIVPSNFAWTLPESISEDQAMLIEPTAVAHHALQKAALEETSTLFVLGLGAIGLLITHLALTRGHRVIVFDPNKTKQKRAVAFGATLYSGNNDAASLKKYLSEQQVTTLFESAGAKDTASLAIASAPRGAQVVLLGLSSSSASFIPLNVVREGIQISPALIYNHPEDFATVIHTIENKKIQPEKIISSSFPLNALQTAFEQAVQGNDSKIRITIK